MKPDPGAFDAGGTRLDVDGGARSMAARFEDLATLGNLMSHAAIDTAGTAAVLHGYLLDPGTLVSAALDPTGVARFEFALALALDAPGGLSWIAAECTLRAIALRGAAATYTVAEKAVTELTTTAEALIDAPAAVLAAGEAVLDGHVNLAWQAALTRDPGLLDVGVDVFGGVRGSAAGAVNSLMDDGHPVVHHQGRDSGADAAGPPRTFTDLITGLNRRNDGKPGEVDVRTLTAANGEVCYVVDIPGTKSWSPGRTANVTSLVTNTRAISGKSTSYERGVLQAMKAAGIKPDDKVMLVGHSQGGLVAVNAAARCAAFGGYNVTHVVTAGSPLGEISPTLPKGVELLAIENKADLVPHADGSDNAAAANVTTVGFNHNEHDIGQNHGLQSAYLEGAAAIDQSTDGSIAAFRESAAPFFSAAKVSTDTYVVSRR